MQTPRPSQNKTERWTSRRVLSSSARAPWPRPAAAVCSSPLAPQAPSSLLLRASLPPAALRALAATPLRRRVLVRTHLALDASSPTPAQLAAERLKGEPLRALQEPFPLSPSRLPHRHSPNWRPSRLAARLRRRSAARQLTKPPHLAEPLSCAAAVGSVGVGERRRGWEPGVQDGRDAQHGGRERADERWMGSATSSERLSRDGTPASFGGPGGGAGGAGEDEPEGPRHQGGDSTEATVGAEERKSREGGAEEGGSGEEGSCAACCSRFGVDVQHLRPPSLEAAGGTGGRRRCLQAPTGGAQVQLGARSDGRRSEEGLEGEGEGEACHDPVGFGCRVRCAVSANTTIANGPSSQLAQTKSRQAIWLESREEGCEARKVQHCDGRSREVRSFTQGSLQADADLLEARRILNRTSRPNRPSPPPPPNHPPPPKRPARPRRRRSPRS